MNLEQSFEVQAPIDVVWEALNDLEQIAPCLPGAAITGHDDDGTYHGTFGVKLGPTTASYRGTIKITAADAANHVATLVGKGTDKRGSGGASATIVNTLTEVDGGTRVDAVTDFTITGKLARFGRGGMIKDISNRLLGDFATCLQAHLQSAGDTAASAAAAAQETQAATTAPAASEEPAETAGGAAAGSAALAGSPGASPSPGASGSTGTSPDAAGESTGNEEPPETAGGAAAGGALAGTAGASPSSPSSGASGTGSSAGTDDAPAEASDAAAGAGAHTTGSAASSGAGTSGPGQSTSGGAGAQPGAPKAAPARPTASKPISATSLLWSVVKDRGARLAAAAWPVIKRRIASLRNRGK